ncbi:pyruvate synthase subunit beta [archaeon]|nr:MAG: pyruvate synthase subunit beta [archaeon]RLG65305.1 MAG: pyruvate synthase subunit beta [archaeon]HDM23847.1 3-methyl-2-oxobutanoate dehydrogenase subunit beta [Candidatus Bathyarchaeota archaeon]
MVSIRDMPKEELLLPGHAACPGCGAMIALRYALKALGKRTIMCVPACCTSVIQGLYPHTSIAVPVLNIAFAAAASTASGISAGLKARNVEDVTVLAWAGDGGTYDIGIQALSGAAERGDDIIYACYDNNAYGNTGIQRSGATPYGAWTTTTPTGKKEHRKPLELIMLEHNIPYVATACSAFPDDLYMKFKKARKIKGPRFILILSPCPIAWRFPSWSTVEIGKLAVKSGAWVLWEYHNGKLEFTGWSKLIAEGKLKKIPVIEYLKHQGRFKPILKDEKAINEIERRINDYWKFMKALKEALK